MKVTGVSLRAIKGRPVVTVHWDETSEFYRPSWATARKLSSVVYELCHEGRAKLRPWLGIGIGWHADITGEP